MNYFGGVHYWRIWEATEATKTKSTDNKTTKQNLQEDIGIKLNWFIWSKTEKKL